MAWFKADDQLPFHPKVLAAGNAAMGLWIRAGTWSSSQLTDGFIPNAIANAMANECDADALVHAGLWDRVEGAGYQFHDWADFQPSATEERKKREARKRAGQKGAAARWHGKPHGKSHSKPHGTPDSTAHGKPDGKTMPRSRSRSQESSTKTHTREEFDQWWEHWRKKKAIGDARKAFPAARKLASLDELIEGADTYFAWVDRNRIEDRFVVGPGAWLRQERWNDELIDRATPDRRQRGHRDADSRDALLQAHFDMEGTRQ